MAAAGGADPYEVLGLSPGADFDSVQRVYNVQKRAAQKARDVEKEKAIQTAFDSIMMGSLSGRLSDIASGKTEAPKEVRYADSTPLFPWRPRVEVETSDNALANVAIYGILAVYAVMNPLTAEYNPLVFGSVACLVRLMQKLAAFSPSPRGDKDAKNTADRMRLLRAVVLTFSCIVLGTLATVTLPMTLVGQFGSAAVPTWVLLYGPTLTNCAGLVFMFLTCTFLR